MYLYVYMLVLQLQRCETERQKNAQQINFQEVNIFCSSQIIRRYQKVLLLR